MTWRWGQHSMRANLHDPRSAEDMAAWIARPIQNLGELLSGREVFTGAELAASDALAREEIDQAVAFAEASPEPEPAILLAAVYAPHAAHVEPAERGTREYGLRPGAERGHGQEMERIPRSS